MAKKKDILTVAVLGDSYESNFSDNNPDGPSELPNFATAGYGYKDSKRICFPCNVGEGESPNKGDVNVNTANGVSSSQGQGHNQAYNYWKGNSGIWNKNRDWPGGNRTGS